MKTTLRSIVLSAGLTAFAYPVIAIAAAAAPAAPVAASRSESAAAKSPATVQVRDVLNVSSPGELLEMTIARYEALGDLLARVTDEKSAREMRPTAERLYFETAMLGIRFTMLPPPSEKDRAAYTASQPRIAAAEARVDRECVRLARMPSVAPHVRSVTFALHGQFEESAARRSASLMSLVQTLRSQIELYKLQHNDFPPDFRANGWKQLTGKTDRTGKVVGASDIGPYLHSNPINPINGKSKLLIVRGRPRPGVVYDTECGFVFDEASHRLWALDADGRLFDETTATARAD